MSHKVSTHEPELQLIYMKKKNKTKTKNNLLFTFRVWYIFIRFLESEPQATEKHHYALKKPQRVTPELQQMFDTWLLHKRSEDAFCS